MQLLLLCISILNQFLYNEIIENALDIYILYCSSQYIYYDSKFLAPVVYFAEPDQTILWAVWAEQHAQFT